MADDDPRYEVEDAAVKDLLREIAKRLDVAIRGANDARPDQPRLGFALFLYEFDPGNAMFWISNGQRADLQRSLREFLAREGGQ